MNQSVSRTYIAKPGTGSEPLSAQQLRFWVLDQLERTDAPHNAAAGLEIRGRLDPTVLNEAIRAVVERHDILRSRFLLENDEPQAVFGYSGLLSIPSVSLTHLPQAERKQTAWTLAAKEFRQAFDLQAGPLFRAALYQLSDTEHLLALTFHGIVCDTVSSLIIRKEIAASYDCIVRNASLPPPGPQYIEYTGSQEQYVHGTRYESDLAYWKNKLEGAPAGLELPTDRPRALVPSFHGAEQFSIISGETLATLRRFSQNEQSSTFLVLLSAFFCLLARYTGGEDLVIGTEVSGRDGSQVSDVVGPVSNQLVLRADCSGDPSFRTVLHRVTEVWAEAHQHKAMPFGKLLEELRVPRDMSRSPLFQVSFNCSSGAGAIVGGGLRWEPVRFHTETEILDLSVNVTEREQESQLRFSYSTDLFERDTIARMLGHFQTLLQGALANPEQAVSQLPLLTEGERRQILVEWNSTAADYPRDVPLNKLIEDQVKLTPDAPALVFESEQLTYAQFNRRANQLAHYLRRSGVGPDVLVGVCAERSIEMMVALLGTIKAGGAYVPLDPEYPHDRLAAMIDDAKPPIVLTQAALLDRLPVSRSRAFCLDSDWESLANEDTADPVILANGKNLAYTIFTSGSTGKPKGVPNVHEAIVNQLLWMKDSYALGTSDRVMQKTPFSFDVSVWEIFWPLTTGACLVIARPGGHKDPSYLMELIAEEKITTIHFVPSMLSIFLEADGAEDCRNIHRVFLSGEAVPLELQQRFFEKLDAELHNLYGPTEAAVHVTYWACNRRSNAHGVPIGRPVANTQIYVLDRNLQPVPVGTAGELHIGGRQLALGYLNRHDLTAEKFIPDPFADDPQARLYKTGDLARFLPDGNVEYLGRIDHQVKLRGFRIELGEIEAVLADYSAIRQAVVVLREDKPGDKRLIGYLVLTSSSELDLESLRNYLASKLPEFMVPSKFVVLEKFPMTTSGKVDRKALPLPQIERSEAELIPPRDELEALLASLFQKVLGLDKVGVKDDFFELGGHSLMAARLILQITMMTGRKIPLATLFRAATVESLAQFIEHEHEAGSDPVVLQIQRGDGDRLPFFAIVPPGEESLGYAMLARHMGHEQTVYKIQGRAPVTGGKRPYSKEEMQALADEYVAAIRAAQPHGPYCLGGLCDGTHIAEQVILILEAQGEEVGLFAIFDTWVMQNSQTRWLWTIHYYAERLQELKQLSFTEMLATCKVILEKKFQVLIGKKPAPTEWPETYWPENFVPWHFRAPVVLFKRPKQQFYYVKDPQMGWGARTESEVEVHEVDFHHLEILREPHVRMFGETLAGCITRLSQRTPNSRVMQESSEQAVLASSIQRSQHGS